MNLQGTLARLRPTNAERCWSATALEGLLEGQKELRQVAKSGGPAPPSGEKIHLEKKKKQPKAPTMQSRGRGTGNDYLTGRDKEEETEAGEEEVEGGGREREEGETVEGEEQVEEGTRFRGSTPPPVLPNAVGGRNEKEFETQRMKEDEEEVSWLVKFVEVKVGRVVHRLFLRRPVTWQLETESDAEEEELQESHT
eukprot:GHVT01043969.1.p1 GENE.GHVT01043969.1~~GHVT01043969.1.p1  ORF type:complete len:196 (+),score=44.77 GHVT01043969.1:505-1092(+)